MQQRLATNASSSRFHHHTPACACCRQRGNQKFSNFSVTQVAVFLGVSYIWAFLSASNPEIQVIDILYYCSYVKLYLTFIKYCSQVHGALGVRQASRRVR